MFIKHTRLRLDENKMKKVLKIKSRLKPAIVSPSTSLVARAGQIMAIIITLALFSMISSMLVTESLGGDAEQINRAGALRMQAMRISRAYLIDSSVDNKIIFTEVNTFEEKITHLFTGGLVSVKDNPKINAQYQEIIKLWQKIKHPGRSMPITIFDEFVAAIDKLVTLLQQESEKKLSLLRLIQGISLLSVLAVASIVLIKLNRSIIIPLKQLVNVAEEAGKGNFDVKVEHQAENELGVLAHTINQMSKQLKSTYQDFEDRVDEKTQELTRSNHSLEVLYRAARNLTNFEYHQIDQQIIFELEQVLGYGKITVEVNEHKPESHIIALIPTRNGNDNICLTPEHFPLEKQGKLFGYLIWHIPKNDTAHAWQKQILQAMADIIATAIELDHRKNTENRLLIIEERAVIARELHDSLAQSLSYLKVQMSLLTRKMQKEVSKEQVSETIEDIKHGLNNAYQQLRELLTTFRLKLEDPSIENALQGTVTEFAEKCQHPIELNYKIPQNYLSANQEIHVLQIVREALSNVQRHADANNAGVSVIKIDNKVKVEIWDDGKGLLKDQQQAGHFGLGIMEERAKSLNTLIQLEERKPQGTRILFEFVQ